MSKTWSAYLVSPFVRIAAGAEISFLCINNGLSITVGMGSVKVSLLNEPRPIDVAWRNSDVPEKRAKFEALKKALYFVNEFSADKDSSEFVQKYTSLDDATKVILDNIAITKGDAGDSLASAIARSKSLVYQEVDYIENKLEIRCDKELAYSELDNKDTQGYGGELGNGFQSIVEESCLNSTSSSSSSSSDFSSSYDSSLTGEDNQ